MPNLSPAESFLALFAGSARAAAIMGDLTEMAATRGRLWFWTAYARTLLSLGWRTPVAFVLAFASMRFIFGPVIRWLVYRRGSHLMDPGLFGNTHLRLISWNFSMVTAQFLVLALPFVLVRFGLRNRLTQLTCALFLIAMPVFSLRARFMDLSSLLIVVATAAALALPQWRRPMIVLAGMGITAVAWKVPFLVGLAHVYRRHLPYLSNSTVVIYDMTAFAIAAIVCVYLYHRLLEQPHTPDRTLA
jgi:hypothetical protein